MVKGNIRIKGLKKLGTIITTVDFNRTILPFYAAKEGHKTLEEARRRMRAKMAAWENPGKEISKSLIIRPSQIKDNKSKRYRMTLLNTAPYANVLETGVKPRYIWRETSPKIATWLDENMGGANAVFVGMPGGGRLGSNIVKGKSERATFNPVIDKMNKKFNDSVNKGIGKGLDKISKRMRKR